VAHVVRPPSSLNPCLRPKLLHGCPASTCFRNLMICSSVNLHFFMPNLSFGNRTLLTFPWH
jgi:hypothetical protein